MCNNIERKTPFGVQSFSWAENLLLDICKVGEYFLFTTCITIHIQIMLTARGYTTAYAQNVAF